MKFKDMNYDELYRTSRRIENFLSQVKDFHSYSKRHLKDEEDNNNIEYWVDNLENDLGILCDEIRDEQDNGQWIKCLKCNGNMGAWFNAGYEPCLRCQGHGKVRENNGPKIL